MTFCDGANIASLFYYLPRQGELHPEAPRFRPERRRATPKIRERQVGKGEHRAEPTYSSQGLLCFPSWFRRNFAANRRGIIIIFPANQVVTNTTTSQEREALYLEGGCISVTNRILIVDFLNTLIPFELISGIIVFNAHRVLWFLFSKRRFSLVSLGVLTSQTNDKSTEAFILRVFRQHNKTGFIKALSDRPADLLKGFFQIEKVMRNLHVKRLQLWPRYSSRILQQSSFSILFGSFGLNAWQISHGGGKGPAQERGPGSY